MSIPPVSARAFRLLLEIAEQEPPLVSARILTEELDGEGAALVARPILVPGPPLLVADIALSGSESQAPVDFDHGTGGYSYFHPELGFVELPADRLRTWRLGTDAFIGIVGRMLGLPASRRPVPLVEGLLWDLGTPRLGRRTGVPVLFARRLAAAEVRAALRPELELRLGAKPAILLTSARWSPCDLSLPAVARIVPVASVLARGTNSAALDLDRLAALSDPRAGLVDRLAQAVRCAEDGAWLSLHGREHAFRGKKKRLVRLLYEAWARGEPWVGEAWLLAEAEYDSARIEDVFKDRRPERRHAWREVVETRDGQVRLRVPAEA